MFTPMTLTARRIVLAATIALAAAAVPAAQSSGPQLLVLNKTDATLAFVDPSSGRVTGTVPTGDGPHELVVSTDGTFAFAGNYGGTTPGNTISVIDVATKKELRRVDVSPLRRPHGLAFADGKLYFTAELNRKVTSRSSLTPARPAARRRRLSSCTSPSVPASRPAAG
jgi:DNA-binding beta-propeller fold protein YncE